MNEKKNEKILFQLNRIEPSDYTTANVYSSLYLCDADVVKGLCSVEAELSKCVLRYLTHTEAGVKDLLNADRDFNWGDVHLDSVCEGSIFQSVTDVKEPFTVKDIITADVDHDAWPGEDFGSDESVVGITYLIVKDADGNVCRVTDRAIQSVDIREGCVDLEEDSYVYADIEAGESLYLQFGTDGYMIPLSIGESSKTHFYINE